MNDQTILWNSKDDCCGCSACKSICPVKAISMQADERGFYYPFIDKEKCINCKQCISVCAFKKEKPNVSNTLNVFAIKAPDDIRKKSSSGGLFTTLSDKVFYERGAVVSAIYDAISHEVVTKLYTDANTRDTARGSKYIQADLKEVFADSYSWIRKNPGKSLLFIGTGCQAAGFKEYVERKKIRKNVLIVDLICNGAPSPGLWKKYANYLEKKENGILEYITFKDKRSGWHTPSVYGIINNQEVSIEGYSDWFYGCYSLRESCYRCPYTCIDRSSDITIGDYWGIEKYYQDFSDEMGVSLAIVHTEIGRRFIEQIKNDVNWIKIEKDQCLQPRLIESAHKPRNRELFWEDIETKGIEYCIKKYKERTGYSSLGELKKKIKKSFVYKTMRNIYRKLDKVNLLINQLKN